MKVFRHLLITAFAALSVTFLLSSFTGATIKDQKSKESVSFAEDVSKIPSSKSYTFSVDFVAKRGREVVVEIWRGNEWITSAIKPVAKGKGNISVNVQTPSRLKRASDYMLKLQLRPVGSTWKEAKAVYQQPNITVR